MWHVLFVGNASLSSLGCFRKRGNARIDISWRETVWLLEFPWQYGVSSYKSNSQYSTATVKQATTSAEFPLEWQ